MQEDRGGWTGIQDRKGGLVQASSHGRGEKWVDPERCGGESIGPADGLDGMARGGVPCDLRLPGQVFSALLLHAGEVTRGWGTSPVGSQSLTTSYMGWTRQLKAWKDFKTSSCPSSCLQTRHRLTPLPKPHLQEKTRRGISKLPQVSTLGVIYFTLVRGFIVSEAWSQLQSI